VRGIGGSAPWPGSGIWELVIDGSHTPTRSATTLSDFRISLLFSREPAA